MAEETGETNMPVFASYKRNSVAHLLKLRETGRSINMFGSTATSLNNSVSDLEFVRSLLCDKSSYLETIAYRTMSASKAPAYCSDRLFTENYQTWFNLCTGPTSGPLLMVSSLLGAADGHAGSVTNRIKVVDVVCISPPINYKPPPSSRCRWVGYHLVLLTKTGWLYEADIESSDIVSKTYIPTTYCATDFFDSSCLRNETGDDDVTSRNDQRTITNYSYLYAHINKESKNIVVMSSRTYQSQLQMSSCAFCLFYIYPLRLQCHFVVSIPSLSPTPPHRTQISDDFFIIKTNRGSRIYFYSLEDIINEYSMDAHWSLNQKVALKRDKTLHAVGQKELGIPYTLRNIVLKGHNFEIESPCLLQVASIRHYFEIGGIPYHYVVPTNKSGTLWVMRHLEDDSNVSCGRLQVDEKWDSSHWQCVRFNDEDGCRLIKQNRSILEVFSIRHEQIACEKKYHCELIRDFSIDLRPVPRWSLDSTTYKLPQVPPTVTSYGRLIKRARRTSVTHIDLPEDDNFILVSAEFDHDLKLFVIVHYRPVGNFSSGWEKEEQGSELVVSLFDGYFGKYLRSFVLDRDVSPSDRDIVGLTLDNDTFIYTVVHGTDESLQYKILRLNRKYGIDAS